MAEKPLEKRVDELTAQVGQLQDRIEELATGMVRMATEVAPHRENPPEVEELAAQVERLQGRVEELATGMVRVAREVAPFPRFAGEEGKSSTGDGIAAWAGSSSLLPRISTLCFLLVVALALRTLTDSGTIEKHAGSVLGMVYASVLVAVGWLQYRKGSSLAPVFSIAGSLLMYSIVIETHSRFGSVPTAAAYLLLAATGTVMALTSRTAGKPMPVVIGTLGMCFAGLALNFPVASLSFLALLLVLANGFAWLSAPMLKRDWLRWAVFFLTAVAVQVWAVRLKVALTSPEIPSSPLHPTLLIPVTALFGLAFFVGALLGMIRTSEKKKRIFNYVVPAASALVFFTAARHVAVPLWGSGLILGGAGLASATVHLGVASWIVRSRKLGAPEFNAFTFAAVVLLVLSLSAATGALLVALPLLSGAALHLAAISHRWQSGGTRFISYLLQAFVAAALSALMLAGETSLPPAVAGLAAGAVGVVAFLHYRWARRQAPPEESFIFSRVDARDYSGATPLLVSLAGWFFLFRLGTYQAVSAAAGGGDVSNAFSGAQSLMISAAAIACLLVSYRLRSREVRNVAILVTLVGAAKVFLFDLVSVDGLPRVLSVFAFGVVAAVASYVLGRWQSGGARRHPDRAGGVTGEADPG